ncbi:lysoplasmalogenase [Paraglaciecola sp.]|uniref:lysoplasmalogenase n=1 Tax=Paraglaciecola sp. TaxID=1920173 RepID=UPI0030F47E71
MTSKTMRAVSYFYWLTALSYLSVSELFTYSLHGLHKALPILFLALSALIMTRGHTRRWLFLALIASSGGDMLLASELQQGFIYGLGTFALAHLCYCWCFLPWFSWSKKPLMFIAVLLVVLVAVVFNVIPHTGNLLIPVLVYMAIILVMACLAIFAKQGVYWLTLGALFFVLSDSLIALNKFVLAIPCEHLLVMSTYYLAQYCLFIGCIKQVKQHVEQ